MFLFPNVTTSYAKEGLLNWFHNVLPALYPFMVIQSVLIDFKFDAFIGKILKPLLKYIFPLSESAFFAIPIGFLCGFPMGAITTVRLYLNQKITKTEAEVLLAFCNNIGPIYTLTMILPLFPKEKHMLILSLMYGIPLLYGSLLTNIHKRKEKTTMSLKVKPTNNKACANAKTTKLHFALTKALRQSGESILVLGGCMVFFSILRIFLYVLPFKQPAFTCMMTGMLEVGSFISVLSQNTQKIGSSTQLLILSAVIIGGLSCIMQTLSITNDTDLSVKKYLFHKLLQTLIWIIVCISLFS